MQFESLQTYYLCLIALITLIVPKILVKTSSSQLFKSLYAAAEMNCLGLKLSNNSSKIFLFTIVPSIDNI